ncbi:dimethylaniline monooxygenase [Aphelenchoides avenae]|nr:dimethylaniline monooxygenase [Aphelenchus avenae]
MKQPIQADVMEYMDELGAIIGAKPDPLSYLLTDPQLAYKLLLGPSLPYSFRLAGPNPWDGARQAIMDVEKRFHQMSIAAQYSCSYNPASGDHIK